MASTPSRFASQLASFWKDDFAPLQAAGQAVLTALREEEAAPDADLYRAITASNPGSHLYFPGSESSSCVTLRWKHIRSDPLPPFLAQQLSTVKSHSLMGLLTPASLVWMSVDHKLYLWSFRHQDESFSCFEVPNRQSVVSVGLVSPKKGVFTDAVEWCLVVTTPVEIHLCALARSNGQSGDVSSMRLVPTSFTLPTDNVRMLSVTGTESGRIFLGGEDGCIYEMMYEGRIPEKMLNGAKMGGVNLPVEECLDEFYDQGKSVPSVIVAGNDDQVVQEVSPVMLGKRAWAAITAPGSSADGTQPRKCRKLNRTAHVSSLVSAVLPDFITRGTSFLFGGKTSTGSGRIVKMVVDEHRKTLYSLSSMGWICAFDLRSYDGVRLASVMDATKTARLYLEAVSRGQTMPPSTQHSSSLGLVTFPGGTLSAQNGVGGMDGARTILKAADVPVRTARNGVAQERNNLLQPVSIQVVDPSESSRLTLVAVTSGGLRLYISSLASNVLFHGPASVRSNTITSRASSANGVLAPGPRMTLCHIRAPPPSDLETAMDTAVVGGISPRLTRSTPLYRVDASLYKRGSLLAAMEYKKPGAGTSRNDRGHRQPVGDILVATAKDSAARKAEMTPLDTPARDKLKERLVVPGGISETISLPMSSAYGTVDDSAIVPGGLIWDITLMPGPDSPVLRLTSNSQTPTDSELGVGFPPAYFPPSKVRSRTLEDGVAMTNGDSSRAIVARDATLSAAALSVLGNVLTNLLLSRPIRTGIIAPYEGDVSPAYQQCYRISKRDGSRGFSSTAGERRVERARPSQAKSSSRSSPSPKSARLRPWLLRPATVPLDDFSTQHLVTKTEIVALNAGGLHYFQMDSFLVSLADAIVSAGDSVERDKKVTSFFTSFGYKEGCAMCLALAVGCGPASGNSTFSEQVRRKALDAALARAFVPKLIARADPQSGNAESVVGSVPTSADPLIPQGYEFKSSALSQALTTTFSRLVRPTWNKPLVVVTEGPCVRRQWTGASRSTPAKVEVLLDEASVEEISRPLRNLLGLMKSKLSRAVKSVPGMPQHQDSMMDIDTKTDESQYLTRALQYQSHLRAGQTGTAAQLTPLEAENIARLIEEKNIHSLYRLLARVVQLFNLITLLRRAQASAELREVDWGLLHGLTTAQLVQTAEGQDRLESLLNALVTASASDRSGSIELSAQADQLANMFAEQCYLFFSPGSRYAYLGLRQASRALATHASSSHRTHLASEAAQNFRQAAQHWHSAPLITGRILHKKGHEAYNQIAMRAMQNGSPLASAVDALVRLGDVASAVEICLAVASNFKSKGVGQDSPSVDFRQAHTYELTWEQNLYHKKRDQAENGSTANSERTVASPSSQTQIMAYGADVTSQDAVDTCYALIFYYLSLLLKSRPPTLANGMVSVCAGARDEEFLSSFFLFLLESGNADTLLRIEKSPELEKWLKDRMDPDLLSRYYTFHGRNKDAGRVLWERGSDSSCNIPLSTRIELVTGALNSLNTALKEEQKSPRSRVSTDVELDQSLKLVEDSLQVAKVQDKILRTVDALGPDLPPEITPEQQERLRMSLVQVSVLYNEYAVGLDLYENCLQMLLICRYDDPEPIKFLWKNIISKEVLPCATRNEASYTMLQSFVSEIGRGSDVHRVSGADFDNSLPVFENGDWINRLEGKVVTLGLELYGQGADYVFPVPFLLYHLDSFRQALPDKLAPEWPVLVLAKAGVPCLVILDTYDGVVLRDNQGLLAGEADGRRVDQFRAIIELLGYWVSSAQAGDNSASRDLARAVTSGRLLPKIDTLKAKLETTANTGALHDRLGNIEVRIQSSV